MRDHKQKQQWEDLGELDPLWAILSDPSRKHGRWDLSDFWKTGDEEIRDLFAVADSLGYPCARHRALDFGCGVGRLTRALAPYFGECWGVDISAPMLSKAQELNSVFPNCRFILNTDVNLRSFPDRHFDLVLTRLVLQHIPQTELIKAWISEFLRVLNQRGLLAFQLPSFVPLRNRLQLRRRAYSVLRQIGVSPRFLYESLTLHPMSMIYMRETSVTEYLASLGAKLLLTRPDPFANDATFGSKIYYVTV